MFAKSVYLLNYMEADNTKYEKKRLIHSLIFPLFFVFVLVMMKIVESGFDLDFSHFGIYPLKVKGLKGILFSPLVHADYRHLVDNCLPLLILSFALFYFYHTLGYKIFFLNYLMVGIWVWAGGRSGYHIGASGLVYGLASFLFFSGVIRNDIRLLAISLLVVFLYGSMIWGIFPIFPYVSWESHMLGSISGLVLAIYYRKYGPQKKIYEWELEDEDEEEEESF